MSRPRVKYSEHNTFTPEHEIAFAQHLVNMHRNGEISSHNIGSRVIPEITRMLNETFGTSFPRNTIQSKYYALQNLTRLYISFKRRGTGMGWDSTNYTFMMDDDRWRHLLQVNKGYGRFYDRSCLVFYLLEEVFMNQGATGDLSAEHGLSPPNSEDELEMENAARRGRGKTAVDVSSSDEEVEVPTTRKGKGKVKKGKRKRKSGDMSTDSFFSGSSPQFQQYFRVLDSLETHLSCKNSSSMSGSVSSPSKTAHPPFDAYAELKAALAKLCALNLDINARLRVADALKDPSERAIWFTCKTDIDRLAFVRHRGFLSPV